MLIHLEKLEKYVISEDYNIEAKHLISAFSSKEKIEYIFDNSKIPANPLSNQYIAALTKSFQSHYGFELNPNDIWLIIVQNLAIHINQNSDKFRDKMVDFEGKKLITINDDSLILGNEANDWSVVLKAFESAIKTNIKDTEIADTIITEFSNSNEIDLTCFRVSLMDICQSYFDFKVRTMCGIPDIDIVGTKEDWIKIIENVAYLAPIFELTSWAKKIIPILTKIVETYDNVVDIPFFKSMYKHNSGSGSSEVTGWINEFFVYQYTNNKIVERTSNSVSTGDFISSVSSVPFIWEYYGKSFAMNFYSGMLGFEVDEAKSLIRIKKNFAITYKD